MLYLVASTLTVSAQGENNHWRFGNKIGLDFTSGSPVLVSSSMASQEGCAAASDASGNLLFYSNGNDIWDATGTIMPNGSGLLGNGMGTVGPGSSTQGVAVVKAIGEPGKYFLFVLDGQVEEPNNGVLRYSVVDMSLHGGLGDIAPGLKNIAIDSFLSEAMAVAKGAGCYYWLVTRSWNTTNYHAYKIGPGGIDPVPVISAGLFGGSPYGEIKLAPDGRFLSLTGGGYQYMEVARFDAATGTVSQAKQLGLPRNGNYGSEFSPDSRKLYLSEGADTLVQYNMDLWPDVPAMEAARIVIEPRRKLGLYNRMRLGPDNKLYIVSNTFAGPPTPAPGYDAPIARLNAPNATGSACGFDSVFIMVPYTQTFIPPGNAFPCGLYGFGFDNKMVVIPDPPQTITTPARDTLVCTGDHAQLQGRPGCNAYVWSDGSTAASATVSEDGIYWVASIRSCTTFIDTFRVRLYHLGTLGPDTFICSGGSLDLDVTSPPGARYRWQDGSEEPTIHVNRPGTYTVTIMLGACRVIDSIRIQELEPSVTITGDDSVFCNGAVLSLKAASVPPGSYTWNTGSTGSLLQVNRSGVYSVTTRNACGTFTASLPVTAEDCSCPVFAPNAFSPNGDGLNDMFQVQTGCQTATFSLAIYNRYGERVFLSRDAGKGWNGMHRGRPAETGTYFYQLKYTGLRSGRQVERKGDLTLLR